MRLSPHFPLRINFTTVRIFLARANAIDRRDSERDTFWPSVAGGDAVELPRGFRTARDSAAASLSPHCYCFCWWPAAGDEVRQGERAGLKPNNGRWRVLLRAHTYFAGLADL
jgi:hypothetical protein